MASTGTCRVRHCAGSTTRPRGAFRTMALPGTPRAERSGAPLPAQREAVARTSSVVVDLPASHARPRCSCDAGTSGRHRRPRRSRRPELTESSYPSIAIAFAMAICVNPRDLRAICDDAMVIFLAFLGAPFRLDSLIALRREDARHLRWMRCSCRTAVRSRLGSLGALAGGSEAGPKGPAYGSILMIPPVGGSFTTRLRALDGPSR